MNPYITGYARTLKLAGYDDAIIAELIKDAGVGQELIDAGTKMPWQEGLHAAGDTLKSMFTRGGDEAAKVVRKGAPAKQVRRSVAVDPRMRSYGAGAFG